MVSRRLLDRLKLVLRNEQLVLLVLALAIGVASAYGAIGFQELYRAVQWVSFGTRAAELYTHAATLPAWQLILVPTLGGLAVGLVIHFVMPGRRPQGVADVMESVALKSGAISVRAGLGAALASAVSIGVGASVGREGPVVHLGASLASGLADRFRLTRSQTVALLGCGVAAAVSASFNAPIAGVFFALEVVIGHYALSAFAPIVIASVAGAIVSRIYFGDFPAFIVPDHSIASFLELPAFALLGVVSAVVAITFLRAVAFTQGVVEKLPVPRWSCPMFAGCLIGLIAVAFPQVLGVGYGAMDAALKEMFPLALLLALIVAKLVATAVALGSGFGGGVFSPSLFLGAMLGGTFGVVATQAFPEFSSGHGAYTLVGMGAVAGAVLGAPISTILIVFELTGDHALTIAVMVAVVISSVLTQQIHGRSFFTWLLEIRGISLRRGREAGLVGSVDIGDLVNRDFSTVPVSATMAEVRDRLVSACHGELFVLRDGGVLVGTITLAELSGAAFDTSLDSLLNAGDVARLHPPVFEATDSVDYALQQMRGLGEEHMGVVDGRDTMRLIGCLHQVDVMQTYNRALLEARREERGET